MSPRISALPPTPRADRRTRFDLRQGISGQDGAPFQDGEQVEPMFGQNGSAIDVGIFRVSDGMGVDAGNGAAYWGEPAACRGGWLAYQT